MESLKPIPRPFDAFHREIAPPRVPAFAEALRAAMYWGDVRRAWRNLTRRIHPRCGRRRNRREQSRFDALRSLADYGHTMCVDRCTNCGKNLADIANTWPSMVCVPVRWVQRYD